MRRLKEDNAKLKAEAQLRVHESDMKYEDLRGFCLQRHDYVLELLAQIDKHMTYISELEETKANLISSVEDKSQTIYDLQDEREKIILEKNTMRNKITDLNYDIEDRDTKIRRLESFVQIHEKELEKLRPLKDQVNGFKTEISQSKTKIRLLEDQLRAY